MSSRVEARREQAARDYALERALLNPAFAGRVVAFRDELARGLELEAACDVSGLKRRTARRLVECPGTLAGAILPESVSADVVAPEPERDQDRRLRGGGNAEVRWGGTMQSGRWDPGCGHSIHGVAVRPEYFDGAPDFSHLPTDEKNRAAADLIWATHEARNNAGLNRRPPERRRGPRSLRRA